MNASRAAILATLHARLSAASKRGAKDERAFEAARCLDAIDEHTEDPRDFSAAFIERQWVRIEALLA